jgi:RES domain-containing protein
VILWRLCRRPHADLSGEGGRRVSGRWHSAGQAVVYAAAEPSLAVLEVRVNLDLPFDLLPEDYVMVAIEAPEDVAVEDLPTLPPAPHEAGDAWLRARRTALLRVPSVVVPQARNVLLNPLHADAAALRIAEISPFAFDARLWS